MNNHLDILIVDDEQVVRETLGDYLSDLGHHVAYAADGQTGLEKIRDTEFDVALIDMHMPRINGLALIDSARNFRPDTSYVVITGHADIQTAIDALRRGAADFLVKPIKLEELDAVLTKAVRLRDLRREGQHLRDTIRGIQGALVQSGEWHFVGKSPAAQKIRQQISEAARAQCKAVLVTGETGTGKEVVARALHLAMFGEEVPFIPVNCPALPRDLVESELFGHVRGAFTGASGDRAGVFELAAGGMLFLDEIGDMAAAAQAALLRVLETRRFRRVGGSKEIEVNLCVIAATNVDLVESLQRGALRRDLYYRLNAYHIHLPPLRERKEDILPLAGHFLAVLGQSRDHSSADFTPDAADWLVRYDYPGNARELKNIIERAWIVRMTSGEHGPLDTRHLHLPAMENVPRDESQTDDELTRLRKALEACRWNRRQAARELGMPYSTFRYKIRRYGIDLQGE